MFPTTVIILIIIMMLVLVSVVVLMTYHHLQLRKESNYYPPLGKLVKVKNKKIHVYAVGRGKQTLVFLSGHGTSCPVLDFKPLWMRLQDEYRVVVMERFGYGWSDASSYSKDIDTLLEETRQALELANQKAPFVLFPHSMSGLQALYWAQKYPHEVQAIIGLDPCTPEAVFTLPKISRFQVKFLHVLSKMGVTRLIPKSGLKEKLLLNQLSDLTTEEKAQYMAMFFRSFLTKDMVKEVAHLQTNARIVQSMKVPKDIPMYFYISHQQAMLAPGWKEALQEYLWHLRIGKYQTLETNHYVYHSCAQQIAQEAKAFLRHVDVAGNHSKNA